MRFVVLVAYGRAFVVLGYPWVVILHSRRTGSEKGFTLYMFMLIISVTWQLLSLSLFSFTPFTQALTCRYLYVCLARTPFALSSPAPQLPKPIRDFPPLPLLVRLSLNVTLVSTQLAFDRT
jgi:hypothetical protein